MNFLAKNHKCTLEDENELQKLVATNAYVQENRDYEYQCDEQQEAVPATGARPVWRCEDGKWVETATCAPISLRMF